MTKSQKRVVWAIACLLVLTGVWQMNAGAPALDKQRIKLTKAFNDGNYKVAYEGLSKLALDPKSNGATVGADLELALASLQHLGRVDEIDDFREAVIKVHADNWRLLSSAAAGYLTGDSHGYIVAGKFYRGGHRGGGRLVNCYERDRVRALQLMQQALEKSKTEEDKAGVAGFHLNFADVLLAQDFWRLQYLTDLAKLPDYTDGFWTPRNHAGTPVDEAGNPVLHKLPKTFAAVETDGERWRWLIHHATILDPNRTSEVEMAFADFMKYQLGVQTMAYRANHHGGETGTFALHTLKDTETIAQLATGVKRFNVPDEYNWIKIYQRVADRARTVFGEQALLNLAQEYEDRRQFPRAAEVWMRAIKEYGPGKDKFRQLRLDQIVGNWGRFEGGTPQAVGTAPLLDFLYRNGKQVAFEAHGVNHAKFLDDVKAYLDTNPGNLLDHNRVALTSLGDRVIGDKKKTYILDKTASWSLDLKPRPNHVDERITVKAPLTKPGLYLVTGQMKDGNVSRLLVPVHDTIIVKKGMLNKSLYFVADAVTGEPVADARADFFGWRQVQVQPPPNRKLQTITDRFTRTTDKDGLIVVDHKDENISNQWLITVVKPKAGAGGADRFASLGFSHFWNRGPHEADYNETRTFVITDRPVYRPEQTVHFKLWVQTSKYDSPTTSSAFAGAKFTLKIYDPKGTEILEKQYQADKYGGLAGEYALPKGATLGVYTMDLVDKNSHHMIASPNGTFHVEEYKKPEFEVTVEALKEPVKLGDKLTATIEAKYYFGSPVTAGVVKYKVTRANHSGGWYPYSRWDWLYGKGHWWFAPDYVWYPGFYEWGCCRPFLPWWGWAGPEEPEIVSENEVAIGPDGKVQVVIDTASVKELRGGQDHDYTITAEVTDQSRRTIVGSGSVIVSRTPFQVYVWLDKGYYRTGDTIEARFRAQTLDQQPVHSGRAKRIEAAAKLLPSPGTPGEGLGGRAEAVDDRANGPHPRPLSHEYTGEGSCGPGAGVPGEQTILAPVQGNGELTLLEVTYNAANEPIEKLVQTWKLETNAQGEAIQQIKAAKPGQYRLSYKVTDAKNNTVEGGYVFLVRGEGFDGAGFRFNDIELTPDQKEYQPGDKVKLNINVNKNNGVVLLFARPVNGYSPIPKVIRLKGKSVIEEIAVVQRDMPNFFIEATTVADGRVHNETREVIVPPMKRVVNVEVTPNQKEYKPGEKATVKLKVTDLEGKPFVGQAVVSVYDKSVEYISDGSNVPEIKEFFWNWRRHHSPHTESSVEGVHWNLLRENETGMNDLGTFGSTVVEELRGKGNLFKAPVKVNANVNDMMMVLPPGRFGLGGMGGGWMGMGGGFGMGMPGMGMGGMGMPGMGMMGGMGGAIADPLAVQGKVGGVPKAGGPVPAIRSKFADTAVWKGSLVTSKDGLAEVAFDMPEQLTAWKIRVWTMGHGATVGQGEAEVVTRRDLIVRLQAPRFFVQKDEVVLSANVHNYLKAEKKVRVSLEFDGGTLSCLDPLTREVKIAAGGEQRVDWRVKVVNEGEAVVRMKAVSDVDADAMEMRFPCFIHGMLKMDTFTGVIRPDKNVARTTFSIPAERRVNETVLEVRYSPSLAGAMVDALPYLVDYPYGCTEQTLNRFLPTVMAQRILLNMKLDLKEIEKHRTNLNSAEIGDDRLRMKGWKRFPRNPVFDEAEVRRMSQAGVDALHRMQYQDGGWGWFSGQGSYSFPHTTAVVVHGLQIAKENDVGLPPNMLENAIEWLKIYQAEQLTLLKNAAIKKRPYKESAADIDAMIYMTLVDAEQNSPAMRDFLYRDRTRISLYAKAMFGLALHKQGQKDKLAMIMQNIEQYVVSDDENQTAYLRLPEESHWWNWYGNGIEANAYYLKLLCKTDAKGERASRMVKYLLNNRKHATYWSSTRDTAVCIEAFADYLKMTGEDRPDMTVEVWLDGKKHKEVRIDKTNLFTFDNKLVLVGDKVTSGKHSLEIKRTGSGPVYWNVYVTNFTLEDFITKAGLEVKINRKYFKLTRVEHKIKVSGSRGQPLDQQIEKYERTELSNLATVRSGDLIEVELEIDSKNDYEYVIFEDPKAAGFEPVSLESGYVGNWHGLGAYKELRDEKVAFFVQNLPRGKHSLNYRMRAEIPGTFSALPTRAYAMYAPELKGNSDEIKIRVEDRK